MREKLEGHGALEFGVLGPANDTHPAFAEFLEDFVVGYCGADHGIGLHVWRSYSS